MRLAVLFKMLKLPPGFGAPPGFELWSSGTGFVGFMWLVS